MLYGNVYILSKTLQLYMFKSVLVKYLIYKYFRKKCRFNFFLNLKHFSVEWRAYNLLKHLQIHQKFKFAAKNFFFFEGPESTALRKL